MTVQDVSALDEVTSICRELLRINTSNDGDHPEQPAAEYVASLLAEAGIEPVITHAAPARASVLARVPGLRPGPALLIHAHLDTVPADAAEWQVHPFSGEFLDGCLWGRGAVDMKDMVAMTLAAVRGLARAGQAPARDVVLAFVAGAEDDGLLGARHVVVRHRDLLEGCADAIGGIGGFSTTLPNGRRIYPIQVAEKGIHRTVLEARSSAETPDPVLALCEAVERIGKHRFPARTTSATGAFLAALEGIAGQTMLPREGIAGSLGELLPGLAPLMSASFCDTAAPTRLHSDPAEPGCGTRATATVDGGFLPGRSEAFDAELRELAGPKVNVSVLRHYPAVEISPDGALLDELGAALRAFDPEAVPVPYMPSAGTDAKWFSSLGIRCYGFTPLRLPSGFNYAQMFHRANERVPVSALQFGVKVLTRLLLGERPESPAVSQRL